MRRLTRLVLWLLLNELRSLVTVGSILTGPHYSITTTGPM
jgi:hypothetical protein